MNDLAEQTNFLLTTHGEALGPSGENFESRWSVNGNIGYFTPLFENDKNWNIW